MNIYEFFSSLIDHIEMFSKALPLSRLFDIFRLYIDTSDLIQCGIPWDFLWEAFTNQGLLMLEEEAKQRFQRRQVSWQEWCWNVESDVMLKSLKMKQICKQNMKQVGKRVIADQLTKITCNRSPY